MGLRSPFFGTPERLPPADQDFWKDARTVLPEGKHPVTLPINRDVFEWFKSHGPRY